MNTIKQISILILLASIISSCKKEVQLQKAIYFWENDRMALNEEENHFLRKQKVEKLYLKFFEVEKDEVEGIIPSAKSTLVLPTDFSNIDIVPTVYIRNEVFKKTTIQDLDELAENTLHLIKKRFKDCCPYNRINFQEIQIDCDWTISTRENYFYFLKSIKKKTNVQVSATLRLYPYKFPDKMGVLPVDRAMLMCYNLLSPLDAGTKNSILDLDELEKYLFGAKDYPLPLDLALPIYSSALMYKSDHFVGIHYLNDTKWLKTHLQQKQKNVFHVLKDTVLEQTFLREGDLIKLELVDKKLLQRALEIIQKNVCFEQGASLSLFHLSTVQSNIFNYEEITSLYSTIFH